MTFGEKIKFCRNSLGLLQTDLAEEIGVSQRTIHSYEKLGAIPHKKNIRKLAKALCVTEEFLFDLQMNYFPLMQKFCQLDSGHIPK